MTRILVQDDDGATQEFCTAYMKMLFDYVMDHATVTMEYEDPIPNGSQVQFKYTDSYGYENLKMLWKDVYIWCINNECIFDDQTIYSSSGLLRLLKDSWVELKLEDDADEDYKITDIEWIIIDEINYISGTDYPEESGERRMAKGNYLLITTDGYSLDDYTFYDTLEQAQTSMKDSFEKMKPSDWFESDEEMSWLRERDAILYGNGEYVFVWNIIEVTKPII